jgi:hypothetical protein
MRSLSRARTHARLIRARLGLESAGLLGLVVAYIESQTGHDLELQPVAASALRGSKAEVNTADGCLYYDQTLTGFELLFVLLHELGHLELHHRLQQVHIAPCGRTRRVDVCGPVHGPHMSGNCFNINHKK